MKNDFELLKIQSASALGIFLALVMVCVATGAAAKASSITKTVHKASHTLGFSNTIVSIKEDYSQTKWPIAHRTLLLRGPDGRVVSLPIHDGGSGRLTTLSLYKHTKPELDERGHAIGGDYVLLGIRDCVGFDPVFLEAKLCAARPPCGNDKRRTGLIYLGRFDWANGYDPPRGQFQFGWRFLPFEEGSEEPFCPEGS